MTALIAATVLGLGAGKLQAQAPNPLQGDYGAHDPMLFKVGADYFVYYTGTGIQTKTSKDKITWKNTGAALPAMPAWHKEYVPTAGTNLWAPDVHFRAGKYWLYYSVSTSGSRVSAIGLATATTINPSGGTVWQDQGMVTSTTGSNDYNAIDPNVYVDSAGAPWLVFGSWWSGIKMFQLDPATGKRLAGSQLYALAYHKNGAEGAFLVKHGEYFYLWLSWDVCCDGVSSTYNIRVGRATQLTGPYLDSKGITLPGQGGDLIDSGDSRWKGPGHNAIFTEGDTTFLVNHAYDAQNNGRATLQIRTLYWTADGWPTLDKAKGQVTGILPGEAVERKAGKHNAGKAIPSARKASRSFVDMQGRKLSGKASLPSRSRVSASAPK